jgi:hypothetical protein
MRIVVCVALALLTTSLTARSDERPTAQQRLAAYEKTVNAMSRAKIELIEKEYRKGDNDPRYKDNKDGFLGTAELTICRDNSRWRISKRSHQFTTWQGKPSEVRTGVEYLLGEHALHIGAVFASPTGVNNELRLSANLDGPGEQKKVHSYLVSADFLFGYGRGDNDQPLWQVMRDASSLEVEPETERIAGSETIVVKSRGRYGAHKLWLDPAIGHLPRRVEVLKETGDNMNDRQLGVEITSPTLPRELESRLRPVPRIPTMYGYRLVVDNIRIENKDGVPVVTGYDFVTTMTFEKERTVEIRNECRVRSMTVGGDALPEADFQPAITIPEGTLVRINGSPAVDRAAYEWRNGRLQKVMNQ